jgi:cytochrome c peroxidase
MRLSNWFNFRYFKQDFRRLIVLLVVGLLLGGIAQVVGRLENQPDYRPLLEKYKRPDKVPFPDDNKYTESREALGKMLFFDPRLSGSGSLSCASCHSPSFAWGDGQPRAIGNGMKQLGRRTPTILNLAWAEGLFWDGRAQTLEEQALGPIAAAGEMNMPLEDMVAKVQSIHGYKELFAKAYPNEPINEKTVAKAIATFERTVVSGQAPFDKWATGNEKAISESAKRGFWLFNNKANCSSCHSGWRFTDDSFHDIGIPGTDLGRGKLMPNFDILQFAFKTPTLRNVEHRAPYMHDGSEKTLEDLVELYNLGGRVQRPSLSREIKPLNLSAQEKRDLVEFLKTLTSEDKPITIPILPR